MSNHDEMPCTPGEALDAVLAVEHALLKRHADGTPPTTTTDAVSRDGVAK